MFRFDANERKYVGILHLFGIDVIVIVINCDLPANCHPTLLLLTVKHTTYDISMTNKCFMPEPVSQSCTKQALQYAGAAI